MNKDKTGTEASPPANGTETLKSLLIGVDSPEPTHPIWLIPARSPEALKSLSAAQRAWLEATDWKAEVGSVALLPGADGALAGAVLGLGDPPHPPLIAGALPRALPNGSYHFAVVPADHDLAVLGWLMGAYGFPAYKSQDRAKTTRLKPPAGSDIEGALAVARAVAMGRDLINTPSNDLGPAELADAALRLAGANNAKSRVIGGDDLARGFPMVHAVGRASARPPCLVDFTWGDEHAPKVTLIGKGICFDTGGLNLKPAQSMALMKKDMGGAASVLACAAMIMQGRLPVRLRVLIPAAENSVSADSFRPGDVLKSRAGINVEIGNTDAEGRLVLADALTLADEEAPELVVTFATLTGAARVALGPDLPALYATDDAFADALVSRSHAIGDPLWRMPFWPPYDQLLKSKIADVNHISEGGFAGSITAALFLKRFAKQAKSYCHFDIYGWVPRAQPGRPEGGEPQGARALFDVLRRRYSS